MFSSESQGTISKNSFSCLLDIVTCDRGVGRRTPFIRNKGCDNIFVTALILYKSHSGFLSAHKMYSVNSFKLFTQRSAPACWNLSATDCFKRSFYSISICWYASYESPISELPSITPTVNTPAFFPSWISETVSPTLITSSTDLFLKYCIFL